MKSNSLTANRTTHWLTEARIFERAGEQTVGANSYLHNLNYLSQVIEKQCFASDLRRALFKSSS
jgi:hypothetical protein